MGYGIGYRDGQGAACTWQSSYGEDTRYWNVNQKMFMYGVGFREGRAAGCDRSTSYNSYRPTPFPP